MKEENSTKKTLKPITAIMTVVMVIVSVLAVMPLSVSANPNQIWPSDAGFEWKNFFGADEIVYVTGELDPTPEDWIFPTARIYVTENREWFGGESLTDVTRGGYNVVTGTGGAGAFFGEIVWLPDLARGKYDLVIDEDQNGIYDGIDYVLGEGTGYAFAVGGPIGVEIDVAAIKGHALVQSQHWDKTALWGHWLSDAASAICIVWNLATGDWVSAVVGIAGIAFGFSTDYNGAVLTIGGKIIEGLAAPQAAHWASLHADPPDPAFTEFATIDIATVNDELAAELAPYGIVATYPFAPKGDTSYEVSEMVLANNMAMQAAQVSALQISLEKYQGADNEGEDYYTYLQAKSVKKFSNMLLDNLDDTRVALTSYKTEQINHIGDPVYNVAEIAAFQGRIATTGFTPGEIEDLKDSGFNDADIEGVTERIASLEVPAEDVTRSEIIEDIITGIDDSIPAFLELSNQAQDVINYLEPLIQPQKHHPVAVPGGPYTGDEGAPITFDGSGSSDPDGDLLTYEWDFDLDGDFDDGFGVIEAWTWDSEFSGLIGLKVTDATGLSDNAFTTVTVSSVNDPPIIDSFAPAELEPAASQSSPLDFSVTAHDPDADLLSYSWTLEGAEVSTGTTWTYTPGADESGQRVVMITVSDNNPLSRDSYERRLVEVLSEVENQPPVADPDGPYPGTEGVAIAFNGSGSYDPDGDIASYAWDFGDGNTSGEERPTHTYAQNGTYTVSLNVTDDDSATDVNTTTATIADTEPTADFSATPTSGLKPLTVNFTDNSTTYDGIAAWEWDFDNNGVVDSTVQNTTYEYTEAGTYTVRLTVYEADGNNDTETKIGYITVTEENQPPVADPNGPYIDTEGVAIAFNGSGSYDPDGDIASYDWDFGDGNTSSEERPTHTYVQNGTYSISLNVTDDDGATDINTTTATIADTEPTADFFGIPTSGLKPLTVNFTDNSTTYDGITTWEWDFDNNGVVDSTVQNSTYEYTEAGTYTVRLTVYEADGNNDTETKIGYITVTEENQPPVSDPNGPYTGTEGVEIAFNGTGSYDPDGDIASYAWDFGDGNTSSDERPTHTYVQNGTYTISLNVTDDDGATDINTTTATIADTEPTADFFGIPTSGLKPLTVNFTDNSTSYDGFTTWDWDFGDGNTSSEQNPTHIYANAGLYNVTLTVHEADSDSDTETKIGYITVTEENQPPVSDPNGPYIDTEGVAIAFNGSGSYDPDGDIASYDWDFGDGNTSSEERPTHTYAQNGTYTVTLNVTDDDGATDINSTTATIADTEPTADFFGIPTSGLKPLTVNFTDNSTTYDGITTWEWDFDNNGVVDSTVQNSTYEYTEAGTYTVRLTVYEADGNNDTETKIGYITVTEENQPPVSDPNGPYTDTEGVAIAFNGSGSYDPDGDIASYDWDFGDGNTGTGVNPTYTYANDGTYIVSLNVTDNEGAYDVNTTTATIADTEPKANFSATPTTGLKPLTVNFADESTSYDGITTWNWDFGDENTSTEQNPTNEYATEGTYTVSLTVSEADGDSDTETKVNYINVTNVNIPPVADPNGPYIGAEGVPILFDGSGSYDPDGDIASYDWDFGDGNTGTGVNPTHTYLGDGTYTVNLTVTDNDGATDINTTTATIADTEPTADFFGIPTSGLKPLTVNFTENSTTYDGFTTWEWDFGDGNTSSDPDPTHLYANAGLYNVTLTVYEADGDSDSEIKIEYINVTEFMDPWAEINNELNALIEKVNAATMPNIIKHRLIDKLEYAKALKDNAHEECLAGNFDGATKKLGVAKNLVESFTSMVKITRRISPEDKTILLAEATEIIGKIDKLIERIETEHRC